MTTESTDRSAAGPSTAFDGLPPLHDGETALPRIHPYDDVVPGRYITPGGGRLTIEKSAGTHHRITLDHLGCDAQTTGLKNDAFKRLALAAEGQCIRAGCKHAARHSINNVHRGFKVRTDWITLNAFVRALLAMNWATSPPLTLSRRRPTPMSGIPRTRPAERTAAPAPTGTRLSLATAKTGSVTPTAANCIG